MGEWKMRVKNMINNIKEFVEIIIIIIVTFVKVFF